MIFISSFYFSQQVDPQLNLSPSGSHGKYHFCGLSRPHPSICGLGQQGQDRSRVRKLPYCGFTERAVVYYMCGVSIETTHMSSWTQAIEILFLQVCAKVCYLQKPVLFHHQTEWKASTNEEHCMMKKQQQTTAVLNVFQCPRGLQWLSQVAS